VITHKVVAVLLTVVAALIFSQIVVVAGVVNGRWHHVPIGLCVTFALTGIAVGLWRLARRQT
jgi:ABC-type thiamin/hydroxymethylpyrimidine transport system permease subunit